MQLSLLLSLALSGTAVLANRPVRMSAMRGNGRGPNADGVAQMLAEHIAANPPELVYPKIEGDPFDWEAYPECSKVCTPPGLKAAGCTFSNDPEDVACMCKCSLFGDPVYECEQTHCSQEDIEVIHYLGNKMCEPVGGFRPRDDTKCKNKPASIEEKEGLKE